MSPAHAMVMPPGMLAAAQRYLAAQAEDKALIGGDQPLTRAERAELELALQWWQAQYALAQGKIRAISARLAGPGR